MSTLEDDYAALANAARELVGAVAAEMTRLVKAFLPKPHEDEDER